MYQNSCPKDAIKVGAGVVKNRSLVANPPKSAPIVSLSIVNKKGQCSRSRGRIEARLRSHTANRLLEIAAVSVACRGGLRRKRKKEKERQESSTSATGACCSRDVSVTQSFAAADPGYYHRGVVCCRGAREGKPFGPPTVVCHGRVPKEKNSCVIVRGMVRHTRRHVLPPPNAAHRLRYGAGQ